MKLSLLDYLVCPICHSELDCKTSLRDDKEIIEGELKCCNCKRTFPILRSIPRMLPNRASIENTKTANAFGWEWQCFSTLHSMDEYRLQFLDWIHPVKSHFFNGKVILDAGCGMGRFALVASRFGAKDVIAVDFSNSVEAARDNARSFPNIHVVQADIYSLPLRSHPHANMDFVYSIGVLHHLPDPEAGFHALVRHVKPGGAIFAWVYGRENNEWLVRFVNPLRAKLTSRLPHFLLYSLSFALALVLQPILKLLYQRLNRSVPLAPLLNILPYKTYLTWLSKFCFRHTHHVIFDHLAAPTAFYIRREEFASWFDRAKLYNVSITWRNHNSWRGLGYFPENPAEYPTVLAD